MAQDQNIQINIVPQAEHAVAGDILTYNIEVTNVSDVPAGEVVVSAYVPEGTSFVNSNGAEGWFTSDPVDESGEIVFVTDRMEVQETVILQLIVQVGSDTVGDVIAVGAVGDVGYENARSQPEPEVTQEAVVVTATPTPNTQQRQATQTVVAEITKEAEALNQQATQTAVAATEQAVPTAVFTPAGNASEAESAQSGVSGATSFLPCVSGATIIALMMMLSMAGFAR